MCLLDQGIVSVGFGILLIFILPNTPERVKRGFTAEEKKIALRRTQEAYNVPHTRPNLRQLVAALKDPKTWFYGNAPLPHLLVSDGEHAPSSRIATCANVSPLPA